MEKKSSVGFVSLSAFIHGAILLGLAVIPAMKLLPDSTQNVEIVTEAGTSPISAISTATTVTPETAARNEPVQEVVAKPEPIKAPKAVEVVKPKKVAVVKKVIDQEMPKKTTKKVVAIEPMKNDLEDDVAAAQAEAESFAKDQKMQPIKEDVAAESDPEDEVVNTAAESAASEAVAKQQVSEQKEEKVEPKEEPMAAPKTQPAVEKLGDIKESRNDGDSSPAAADMGTNAGPSNDELRSYLDLKQLSGNKSPQYPATARRKGEQGQVMLNYYVTQQGTVKDVRIAKSSGYNDLDREAVRAAGQLRFVAGQEGWTSHPVVFSLKGQASPAASRLRTAGSTSKGE